MVWVNGEEDRMKNNRKDDLGCILKPPYYTISKQPEVARQIIAEVCRRDIYRFRLNKLDIAFNPSTRTRVMLWMRHLGLFTIYSNNSRGVLYQREFKYLGHALRVIDDAS